MHGYRRAWVATLTLIVGLGAAAGVSAWWYRTTRPLYRLRQGQEALRHGRPDKADRLAESLEADGHSDYAHLLRGEAFLREHQFDQAIHEFQRIQDESDLRVEASAIYGLAFLSVKRLWEAEQLLRYVVSKQPDHLDAHRGLAAIYYDQGALTLAVHHAKECARLEPHKGYPFWFMAVIYKDLGQYASALEAYREASQRELSSQQADEVQEGLAEVLTLQKDYARALAILEQCPAAVSAKLMMLACRAECLWGLGRASEAKQLLDSLLSKQPHVPEALRLRAKLYLSDNEPQKAATLLEEAVQHDRHDYQSRYQLAQAYQMLGRSSDAAEQERLCKQTQEYLAELTSLNEAVAERPWDVTMRNRLANVCDRLDKHDLAAMWRQAAAAALTPLGGSSANRR
ncbi:MAG TPA: tetratricopeptide repeat protein [Gemmataceae bacterium]|nr:tetratricopeptide repeat protein [Gemmataceae bacterium]